MRLQEFCLKLLSFPWLAKFAEWKFHCAEFRTTTRFPLITLPGGTFAPTAATTTLTQAPPTFAPITTTPRSQDCTTPSSTPGNCINYRFCSQIVNMIIQNQQKKDEATENYIKKSVCGYDGADVKVCCAAFVFGETGTSVATTTTSNPAPFIFSAVQTTLTQSTTASSGGGGGGAPTFGPLPTSPGAVTSNPPPSTPTPSQPSPIIFGPAGSSTNPATAPPQPTAPPPPLINRLPTYESDKCGVSAAVRTRIVGGANAPRGAYPWLAALGYRTPSIRFLCGGTLVTQKHVVSAAHCILDTLTKIRLGAHDITSTTEGSIDFDIEYKIAHESYDQKFIVNDISIIRLVGIVNITNFIRPICIQMTDMSKDYTGQMPWVAGWGSTSFRGPGSSILQEVQLPVVSTAECEFNYRLYFPNQVFDNRVLCAGFPQGGKDSCQGDSGGALVLPVQSSDGSSSYFIFLGVVSYGFECARPNFPGIYTRISPSFVPWIQNKINQ